jgi:hypothetical protein
MPGSFKKFNIYIYIYIFFFKKKKKKSQGYFENFDSI